MTSTASDFILKIKQGVAALGLMTLLSGCEGSCDELLEKVCGEWEEPQKCAEWTAIAETAGEDSCAESLKRLEDYER